MATDNKIDGPEVPLDKVEPLKATDFNYYTFPYENLVFDAGGIKAKSYLGCLKALEEAGILGQIKRFAGVSGGAIAATICALGYNLPESEELLDVDFKKLIYDRNCCCFVTNIIPNIFRLFGVVEGDSFYKFAKDLVAGRSRNPHYTFQQLYDDTGRELCIVASNITLMTEDYFHPKTTPNMEIATAIMCSCAIPGIFKPVLFNGCYYQDGAVTCSYPIHCFDGWYLSMKKEHHFFKHFTEVRDVNLVRDGRFKDHNDKTLGIMLYGMRTSDMLQYQIQKQQGVVQPKKLPETKLSTKRISKCEKDMQKRAMIREPDLTLIESFLKHLYKHNKSDDGEIKLEEFKEACKEMAALPDGDNPLVFIFDKVDASLSHDEMFHALDCRHKGKITMMDITHFLQIEGFFFWEYFFGYRHIPIKDISSASKLFRLTHSTVVQMAKRVYIKEMDAKRSCGVYSTYVHARDWRLEPKDLLMLKEQGYDSMVAFLNHYNSVHKLPVKALSPNAIHRMNEVNLYNADKKEEK